MKRNARYEPIGIGLCADCRWRREQQSRRGQTFHRCARADEDDRFVRYPPIPVLRCPGHEPKAQPSH